MKNTVTEKPYVPSPDERVSIGQRAGTPRSLVERVEKSYRLYKASGTMKKSTLPNYAKGGVGVGPLGPSAPKTGSPLGSIKLSASSARHKSTDIAKIIYGSKSR